MLGIAVGILIHFWIGLVISGVLGVTGFVISIVKKRNILKWFLLTVVTTIIIEFLLLMSLGPIIEWIGEEKLDLMYQLGLWLSYVGAFYTIFLIQILITDKGIKNSLLFHLILGVITIILYFNNNKDLIVIFIYTLFSLVSLFLIMLVKKIKNRKNV